MSDRELTGQSPMKLANDTMSSLPADIARPRYDRTALKAGIVHVGLGNFHRAHQAWYLHRLMQQGLALDWAIIGAGMRPYDAAMRDKLLEQDCLTTLIELDPAGASAEVVGSMIDYLPVEDGNAPLIAAMANPRIRIVAMTVTEGGYYIDPAEGTFDARHPDIRHDAANPETPRTVFGAIIAALKQRRADGTGPFTVQSCDNLQGNGAITRSAVLGLARLSAPDLADWIDLNCSFPNSMVDCIVPATGEKEIALARRFGLDDAAPVTHENYRQWVIEDKFCAGRPEWERVGAIVTDQVHDFETMKIRILNAGHQVIANPGELLSLETIADCMSHPVIRPMFLKIEREEIAPYVKPVPGMTPDAYVDLIESRFAFEGAEVEELIALGEEAVENSNQLYAFTRVVKTGFDFKDRIEMIEMLWDVACADGEIHDFEANLVRRVAGLIHVSDRDSGAARKRALARMGGSGAAQ